MRRGAALAWLALGAASAIAGSALATTWEDRQDEAGLDFTHTGSGGGSPHFVEAVGSGACWGDVDGDGFADAYLVNQLYNDTDQNALLDPHSHLFLSNGDGTFLDWSPATGADHRGWGTGCSFADIDGDGDLDLLVTGYARYTLYRNDGGGRFQALHDSGITAEGKCGEKRCWGAGSAWGDYDGDGDLDAYVTNYVDFDIEDGGIIGPESYNGQTNLLFRNDGGGKFTDVTAAANASDDPGPLHSKAFQPVWFDHDGDGWLDLYVASDGTPNSLLLNEPGPDGGRRFRDIAREAGVDDTLSSMGLDIADEGGDGWPDLYFTHFQLQHNGFYVSRGDGTYRDRSGDGELADDWEHVGWGTGFHDLDHDGDVDIYAVNGHVFTGEAIYAQSALLFLRQPDGSYVNATGEAGESFAKRSVARGSAVADYDNDGDLDILVNNADDGEARLFRANNVTGHWLQVELRSPGPNTRGVGAWVVARLASGQEMHRLVKAGNSYQSQDWDTVHFGLGEALAVQELEVRWPSGLVQAWGPVAADQRVQLREGSAEVRDDTIAPLTTMTPSGPAGSGGWYRGPVDVAFTAVDRGMTRVSGVARTEARLDGGPWVVLDGPLHVGAEGRHVVEMRSVDRAGNVEPPRRLAVDIDATPPRTFAHRHGEQGEAGWFTSAVHVAFEAGDALSGVQATVASLDGGPWRPSETLLTLTESGFHEVGFYSVDVAGNVEQERRTFVRIDRRPPELEAFPAVAVPGLPLAALAHARDDVSRLARVSFYLDDEPSPRHVAEPEDGLVSWELGDLALAPGLHRLRVVAQDRAGLATEQETLLLAMPAAPLLLGEARRWQAPG